jgi:hypothetical protein
VSAFAQTSIGDLDISTGNLRVERTIAQVTAWKLTNLFFFFLGEWFADTRQGLPYFQYVYVSNPNLRQIATIFERVIRAAPGVASVTQVALDYQPRARTLGASFSATTDDGATLSGGIGVPFIISGQPGSQL